MTVLCLVGTLTFAAGCERALGLHDWQRDILGLAVGSGVGIVANLLLPALQASNVRVERNCFENGVPVDCSELPNDGEV
jgi:hypothetical protein